MLAFRSRNFTSIPPSQRESDEFACEGGEISRGVRSLRNNWHETGGIARAWRILGKGRVTLSVSLFLSYMKENKNNFVTRDRIRSKFGRPRVGLCPISAKSHVLMNRADRGEIGLGRAGLARLCRCTCASCDGVLRNSICARGKSLPYPTHSGRPRHKYLSFEDARCICNNALLRFT